MGTGKNKDHWVVVVSHTQHEELLRKMHEGNTSGHLDIKGTLGWLWQHMYWVGLRQYVQEWCHTYCVCSKERSFPGDTCSPPAVPD